MQYWLLNVGYKLHFFTTDVNGHFWCSVVSKITEEQGIKNVQVSTKNIRPTLSDYHVYVATAAVK